MCSSDLAGVTQAMLCQVERGTKNPSLQLGAEIAKILDCSLESLLMEYVALEEDGK